MIELKNVSKSYGSKVAVRDVSFKLGQGGLVGLFGEQHGQVHHNEVYAGPAQLQGRGAARRRAHHDERISNACPSPRASTPSSPPSRPGPRGVLRSALDLQRKSASAC